MTEEIKNCYVRRRCVCACVCVCVLIFKCHGIKGWTSFKSKHAALNHPIYLKELWLTVIIHWIKTKTSRLLLIFMQSVCQAHLYFARKTALKCKQQVCCNDEHYSANVNMYNETTNNYKTVTVQVNPSSKHSPITHISDTVIWQINSQIFHRSSRQHSSVRNTKLLCNTLRYFHDTSATARQASAKHHETKSYVQCKNDISWFLDLPNMCDLGWATTTFRNSDGSIFKSKPLKMQPTKISETSSSAKPTHTVGKPKNETKYHSDDGECSKTQNCNNGLACQLYCQCIMCDLLRVKTHIQRSGEQLVI